MNKVYIASALIFSITSFYSYAGEIDSNNITTFTSGTVISSSEVNTAVNEVVTQINDNATNINSLTAPTDYTGIQSLLTGRYVGTYHGIERTSGDSSYSFSSGLVTAQLNNGVGTIIFTGKEIAAFAIVDYDGSNLPTTIDNSGSAPITFTTDANGNISTTIPGSTVSFTLTGYVDKKGEKIYLADKELNSQFQVINIFKQ